MHPAMYQMITIPFSHYCEKARWVLDRNEIPYVEAKYMPTLHFAAAARTQFGRGAGRADEVSTRFSTPILRGEGIQLSDSSDIVRHIEPTLYDPPDADELDCYFSQKLGPHTRRFAYFHGIGNSELLHDLAAKNVGRLQARLFRATLPISTRLIRKSLGVHAVGYERSVERTRKVADEVSERLSDGRAYLCGDAFSAADLTFAAMLAPAILPGPEDFGAVLPSVESLPYGARQFVRELRAHPAGLFAQRMFREERRGRSGGGGVSALRDDRASSALLT